MRTFKPLRPKAILPERKKLLAFVLRLDRPFAEYAEKTHDELFVYARRWGFFNKYRKPKPKS